jgi:adenine phosphoribosyltransferase
MDYKSKIRDIPDFPEKGILFRDIAPLLEDKEAFSQMAEDMTLMVKELNTDKVVGIDARGFIFASVLAIKLGAGLVMVRKKGKLPFETEAVEYDLEYGTATLELQRDSIKPGERVLLVDDVLATGGTMKAAAQLVERLGGEVTGIAFLATLDYLPGREKLKDYSLYSLVSYD